MGRVWGVGWDGVGRGAGGCPSTPRSTCGAQPAQPSAAQHSLELGSDPHHVVFVQVGQPCRHLPEVVLSHGLRQVALRGQGAGAHQRSGLTVLHHHQQLKEGEVGG